MPALIIAANLPDIDAPCSLYGVESLAMRRGLTHGPIALVILPLLLAGLLILYDRWQTQRGKRPEGRLPVHPGWLLALCYIGTLTHPAFDWLNNYGIRLLEPFSSQWFYGDALFIVDPWLLAILGMGLWASRRREVRSAPQPFRPARAAIVGVIAYVAVNLAISANAVAQVRRILPSASVVVANPVPLAFWRRDVLWRAQGHFGSLPHSLFSAAPRDRAPPAALTGMDDPRLSERIAASAPARAFLFWSRMPIAESDGDRIVLGDQRFAGRAALGPFTVTLPPP